MLYIFTSLYPTQTRNAGGYINERLKILQKENIPYKIYVPVISYSPLSHLLLRILRINTNTNPVSWCANAEIIIVHRYLIDIIIDRISPYHYTKKLYKSLLRAELPITSDTIFHAQYYYPLGFCVSKLAQKCGVKSIVTCHDSNSISSINRLRLHKRKYISSILKSTDKLIFVSQNMLDLASSLHQISDNAVVINNGMNHDHFYPVPLDTAIKETRYRPSKKYVVGFIGRLSYEKRADKFPEIFTKIKDILVDVEFIVIGPHPKKKYVTKLNKLPFDVKLVGSVPKEKIFAWYNIFDVLILPSRRESWGLVIREAYACGVPVVGSDVEGIPESMGGLGVLVPDGEDFEDRFATEVCNILLGKTVIDSEKLIEFAQDTTWDMQTKKEIDVYNSLGNASTQNNQDG